MASAPRGRYVPVDEDAELSVLAAILTQPDAFLDVTDRLEPSDFGILAHQTIFEAMLRLDAANRPIDQITVADQLKRMRQLDRVGGPDFLARLAEISVKGSNPGAHADIIAEKSLLRRVHAASSENIEDALAPEARGTAVLTAAEERIFSIEQKRQRSHMVTMPEVVAEVVAEITRARTTALPGLSTGFARLDRMIGGLQAGKLYILGARPGMGKSALAAQIAYHAAAVEGAHPLLVSYEMPIREIGMRMVASELGFSSHRLAQSDVPPEMERDLAAALSKVNDLEMTIDDRPPLSVSGLAGGLRRLARRSPIGLVVVDYLQLMQGDRYARGDNRVQEVSEISRALKLLAVDMNVPILGLSQLSRGLESRQDKRPQLSDLRESGSIEQDADCVLFLYREGQYRDDVEATVAEIIVAKHRGGPTGPIAVSFEGDRGPRFVDLPDAEPARRNLPPAGRGGNGDRPF